MTPPCHSFPAAELPRLVQQDVHGRRRKTAAGAGAGARVDLRACELLRMMQYSCEVERPLRKDGAVRCYPVERLFRRCQDKKGTFTVETTSWERSQHNHNHTTSNDPSSDASSRPAQRPTQWSNNWTDADVASR